MKVFIINKKFIFISFFIILFSFLIVLFIYRNYPNSAITTFNPIDSSKEYLLDLNGDGIKDSLKIVKNNSSPDIKITTKDKSYFLSEYTNNNFKSTTSFPLKVYVFTTIRNNTPLILVQYNDNTDIFSWNGNYFDDLLTLKGNIFGILNSENNKSPNFYSFSSSVGTSNLNSYMILNNKVINTKENSSIFDMKNLIEFIDLIEKNYEVENLPDIFLNSIDSSNLSILFNLDKEHNTYSFQNGFFYDDSFDENDNANSIKYRLSFEKFNTSSSSKKELIIYVTISKDYENNFKISSISLK